MKIILVALLLFGLASSEEESSLDINDFVTNVEVISQVSTWLHYCFWAYTVYHAGAQDVTREIERN